MLLLWIHTSLLWLLHPFYMSVTQIEMFANKPMQVTCRIFTDDLEAALKSDFKKSIDLTHPTNINLADSCLKLYINNKLLIKTDNVLMPLTYLGYEITDDATTIYLESYAGFKRNVWVKNTILLNRLKEQLNIVHVVQNGKTLSNKCNTDTQVVSFNLTGQ
jgi:hypothetical protein